MGKLKEIVIDADHPASLARFWAAAVDGYAVRPYDDAEIARLAALGLTPETDPFVLVDGPGRSSAASCAADRGSSATASISTSPRRTGRRKWRGCSRLGRRFWCEDDRLHRAARPRGQPVLRRRRALGACRLAAGVSSGSGWPRLSATSMRRTSASAALVTALRSSPSVERPRDAEGDGDVLARPAGQHFLDVLQHRLALDPGDQRCARSG